MRLLALSIVVAALLAACGGDDGEDVRADRPAAEPGPPDRPPDSTGPVSGTTAGSVRIDDGTGVLTAVSARVDDDTRLLRRRGEAYEEVALDAIRIGDQVEVWVDGPVAESHPVQAHAEAVVLAP
jgi:Protein of unknown function (DUF3221)